jgi:hypothetical protein
VAGKIKEQVIMPSIPQSVLWISLVVLWLFVLVPMMINKRDAVRRTSDVALTTRVLNTGPAARLLKRGGPAAGHRSNPDWRPMENEYDDLDDPDEDDAGDTPRSSEVGVMSAAASAENTGDVEVVDEDSVAHPAANKAVTTPSCSVDVLSEQAFNDEPASYQDTRAESDAKASEEEVEASEEEQTCVDESADRYEYIDDTSGIAVAEDSPVTVASAASRRRRFDSNTAAVVSARKYAFRKRVLMTLVLMLVGFLAAGLSRVPTAWWFCGGTAALTVLYLGYLRRQTRIEEQVRRRRTQRIARSRLGVENTIDREFDLVPVRLRRPGAVVLEIDDEDPIFNHLDYAPYERGYGWHRDLARAAGQ